MPSLPAAPEADEPLPPQAADAVLPALPALPANGPLPAPHVLDDCPASSLPKEGEGNESQNKDEEDEELTRIMNAPITTPSPLGLDDDPEGSSSRNEIEVDSAKIAMASDVSPQEMEEVLNMPESQRKMLLADGSLDFLKDVPKEERASAVASMTIAMKSGCAAAGSGCEPKPIATPARAAIEGLVKGKAFVETPLSTGSAQKMLVYVLWGCMSVTVLLHVHACCFVLAACLLQVHLNKSRC